MAINIHLYLGDVSEIKSIEKCSSFIHILYSFNYHFLQLVLLLLVNVAPNMVILTSFGK